HPGAVGTRWAHPIGGGQARHRMAALRFKARRRCRRRRARPRSLECPKATGSRVIGCPPASEGKMPKYLCLQRSLGSGGGQGDKPSPAQMQAMYGKFNAWREKFKENLSDLGGRLGKGKLALPDPAPDGPFVEVKELV